MGKPLKTISGRRATGHVLPEFLYQPEVGSWRDSWSVIWAHVSMIRVGDTFMAAVGTIIGARLSGIENLSPGMILLVMTAISMLSAGSMIFNDWRDAAIDLINKPRRAIPSGKVPRGRALIMAGVMFLLAVVFAAVADPKLGMCLAIMVGAAVLYTLKLKQVPFLGNTLVAILAASPIWCWLLLASNPSSTFIVLILALVLLNLGREIARTVEDIPGDQAHHISTVATTFGAGKTTLISASLVTIALLLTWGPVVLGTATWLYFTAVSFTSVFTIIYGAKGLSAACPAPARQWAICGKIATVILALGAGIGITNLA